jgi:hypothetical protein
MDGIIAFLTGVGGILLGAFVLVLLVGWYFLWRASRKLKETT